MWNRLFGPEQASQIVSRQLESDADFELCESYYYELHRKFCGARPRRGQ